MTPIVVGIFLFYVLFKHLKKKESCNIKVNIDNFDF